MPREGASAGFDAVPVCAFCIEYLTSACSSFFPPGSTLDQERRLVTAGGRNYLRNLSLTRLKKYVDAYNIKADGVIEKDDLIEKIIAARVSIRLNNAIVYHRHRPPIIGERMFAVCE
jgi:hypothetical protein